MRLVYPLYALSGLVSLGYQVAWFRIFVDRFGSTNLTFVLVLCNFIGGLGAGAMLSRRVTGGLRWLSGIKDPLRVYGLVEVLVAASILITVVAGLIPPETWGRFPYRLAGGVYHLSFAYRAATLGVAVVCVLIPSILMGVTFPLLCHAFRHEVRFPSMLYAWNTLGACIGVLLCEFVLLPRVGHDSTLLVMMVTNLGLGLFFLAAGRRAAPGSTQDAAADAATASSAARTPAAGGRYGVLLLLAVLSGLIAGAFEGDVFKRLKFLGCSLDVGMSFISFWAIVGIFLGSATVRMLPRLRLGWIKIGSVVAFALFWATWHGALAWRDETTDLAFSPGLGGVLLLTGVFVLPSFYLLSLLLPWTCNQIQAGRRHLGLAYGLNTFAFCLGMVGFTWLAPRVNIFFSLKVFIVFFAVQVGLLLSLRTSSQRLTWRVLAATAVLAVAIVVTPRAFDPGYFPSYDMAAKYPVTAMRSNAAETTFVVEMPRFKILYFTYHAMSATSPRGQRYMRLMAHVPLLAQREPRRALLICFGVGNTASAIAMHDTIEAIDVVDLNENVFATASEFRATNHDVILDERLTLIHDDGRNFLHRTDRLYDLVTSEPPPPRNEGVYRLYSREYYEDVLAHLTPTGMMTQWLPIYQMSPAAVALVVATFIDAFPHAELFTGDGEDYILVGSRVPIDYACLERRFDPETRVGTDLRRIDIVRPLEIVARVVQGDSTLRRRYGGDPIISDQRNDLAHTLYDPESPSLVTYDPLATLADVGAERLAMHASLRRTVTNLARLKRFVRDFPQSALMSVETPGVVHADVDWDLLDQYNKAARRAYSEGEFDRARAILRRGLDLLPVHADMLRVLGMVELRRGALKASIATFDRFRTLGPPDMHSEYGTGAALLGLDRANDAIPFLQRATRMDPDDAEYHRTLARSLAAVGRFAEAVAAYDGAIALDPSDAASRAERARAVENRR